jgi:striatin 1/3/4
MFVLWEIDKYTIAPNRSLYQKFPHNQRDCEVECKVSDAMLGCAQAVLRVPCESPASRVRAHPTRSLLVTAHEDRHIRFWDAASGRCAHAMVAHLDAVTGLALDPNGLFLLSGSHDCSVRLWNLDTKTCVQEITAHRKKFDESILDVAFHPLRPYIASAGADCLAKVFV